MVAGLPPWPPGFQNALLSHWIQIVVGGFIYHLASPGIPMRFGLHDGYGPFVQLPGERTRGETVIVRVSFAPGREARGSLLFDSGAGWAVWSDGEDRVIVCSRPGSTGVPEPACALRVRPGDSEVSLECLPPMLVTGPAARYLDDPLRHPADRLLTMYLLGERGLILEAAALETGGAGILCAGASSTGKTTLARLAAGAGWRLLSDRQATVRLDDDAGPQVQGTPWPGGGPGADGRTVPLRALVFLEPGPVDELRELSPPESRERLLRTACLPSFDERRLGPARRACEELLRRVPARLFVFRDHPLAVDVLGRALTLA